MRGRIHILIGGHLSTAPRARKEAMALMEAGHDVEVSGVWFDEEAAERDRHVMARTGIRFAPALDFRGGTARGEWRRTRVRLEARWARERFARAGHFSPRLLGYGAPELLQRAQQRAADLTIVHSEAGLWVGRELLRRGFQVGIDFEDWFSRDLPAEARRERPVAMLEELERFVARRAAYVLVPSRAMARTLAECYRIEEPEVIYNAFPWAERALLDGLRQDRGGAGRSLHWFSQTIGPGRGLEELLTALPLLKSGVTLYLRGACSPTTRRWLERHMTPECRAQVVILPLVSSEELPSRIAEHDIGLALESPEIPSRDLSVSNKLFQYLQAGLAVIASDTQGQREVLERCRQAGVLLRDLKPESLAHAIDPFLSQPARLAAAKHDALAAAENIFCWERQKTQLVMRAERALPRP